jgi:Ca2+-binding RTX toxin-like protein
MLDPLEPRLLLYGFIGTEGDDNVVIVPAETPGWVAIREHGFNTLYSATEKLHMELGAGNDTVTVNLPESFTTTYPKFGLDVVAGSGNDTINASNGADQIQGEAGDDLIFALGGNDKVFGGDGNDVIHGGNGRDTIYGNTGNDSIRGNGHVDYLFGDDGYDTLYGDAGDDHIQGNANPDRIRGGDGSDELIGNGGRDIIAGEAGNDTLYGSAGNDVLAGGADSDTFGDAGPLDVNDFVAGQDFMTTTVISTDLISAPSLATDAGSLVIHYRLRGADSFHLLT